MNNRYVFKNALGKLVSCLQRLLIRTKINCPITGNSLIIKNSVLLNLFGRFQSALPLRSVLSLLLAGNLNALSEILPVIL